jgi:predicted glycoside hydrolase/deacetylase ChbG (UPF0249 family)
MIIINSDDFGYSPEVNYAIVKAFQRNLISSTTTLVNFPEGFLDAQELLSKNEVSSSNLGIHFNLTEGVPVTLAISENPIFCENGKFNGAIRKKGLFFLDKKSNEQVYNELEGQLQKFINELGFLPSHIDGHHHIHTEWAIGNHVRKLAKKYKINKIRITRNTGIEDSFVKKIYRRIYNRTLGLGGFVCVAKFGDINDMMECGFNKDSNYEIMVHAISCESDKDLILDLDRNNLHDQLLKLFKSDDWTLASYSNLK